MARISGRHHRVQRLHLAVVHARGDRLARHEVGDRTPDGNVVRRLAGHVEHQVADTAARTQVDPETLLLLERRDLGRRERLERHVDLALLQRELHRRRLRVVVDDQVRRLRLRTPVARSWPGRRPAAPACTSTSLYGPVPICCDVFGMSLSGAYVSLGTMLQHCVARIEGHVTCGDLRWNVTAYLPFVVTLFRFPMSGEGELAAACFTIDLFVTRSIENFTSVESNGAAVLERDALAKVAAPRLQAPDREALRRERWLELRARSDSCSRCSKTLLVERERAVVVRPRWVDVRDRVRRPVDERVARRRATKCGLPCARAQERRRRGRPRSSSAPMRQLIGLRFM